MNESVEVKGYCDGRFSSVKDAFQEHFDRGLEVGASYAVTIDGEFVIDIYGGFADEAKTRAWEYDTIVNVFSSTKLMTALCGWILIDRGLLDPDAPVASYWPEFARNGKEDMPVRYLFSHSAGLAGFEIPVPVEQWYDWDYIVGLLAGQKPMWEPGTQSGYHGLTMGFLVGELVRRISGKSLGTFFRDEVAKPLGADFFIGLPEGYDSRAGEMIPVPSPETGKTGPAPLDPDTIRGKVRLNQPMDHSVVNTIPWRRAELPAINGHGNAHSMAKITAALSCGGELNGVKLLSPATLELVMEEQTNGIDLVLNELVRWGLGVELNNIERSLSPNNRVFSWGGAGGSMMVVDMDARISWAYVMNKMEDGPQFFDKRNQHLADVLYAACKK